jgi:UDP-N-acetylglucosamine 2-epimerase (non-hydrolysing)
MKVGPILSELAARGHGSVLVHTGQHYDADMSDSFFADLKLPAPAYHLGAGSGTHAVQTARVMTAFEPVLLEQSPDWVVVVGDVNSTLACALVTAKLRGDIGARVAHVEAGLRSRDWRMPEEVNRVLTDRIADLLLTPSHDVRKNLLEEGTDPSRIVFVGNVMIDSLLQSLERARSEDMPGRLGVPCQGYAAVTLHRPSNVDEPAALRGIMTAVKEIAARMPVVMPLHPRTRQNIARFGLEDLITGVTILDPLPYLKMLSLMDGASVVLTDSGGLQEETTVLGVPCVTLRESTERPITVTEGTNRLARWPLTVAGIISTMEEALAAGRVSVGSRSPDGWDGRAAARIVDALESHSPEPVDQLA